MNKDELRKLYLEKRLSLGVEEYADLNQRLCENFFVHLELSTVKVLHIFLPIAKNNEPDTWQIIARIKKEFPHIRISVPKVISQEKKLESFYFEGPDQLSTSAWGMQEPNRGVLTDVREIDLVVVPLLAFDQSGHRVGYGKGFYDRFLEECRIDCLRVGISLFPPVDTIDPVNEHDQLLSCCITPFGFFNYSRT